MPNHTLLSCIAFTYIKIKHNKISNNYIDWFENNNNKINAALYANEIMKNK